MNLTSGLKGTDPFIGLFRRKVGLTPAQYRKRFGGLRKILQTTGN